MHEPSQTPEELRRLWLIVNESDNAIVVAGPDTRIIHVNAGFTRMLGYTQEEMLGRKISEVLLGPQTDMQAVQAMLRSLTQPGAKQADLLFYRKSGRPLWVSVVANPVFGADGRFENVVGVFTDITHTKMHEVLQHKVLDAMAHERPMLEVMNLVCREVERIAPEVVATLLSVDAGGHLHTLAAPSLAASYSALFEGHPIGPEVGSCGTAAWRGEAVEVHDIATDPLWADFKEDALRIGLHACWSTPIKANDGRVLGTFAFYYREPRAPDALHRRLVEASVHLCALALEREEAKARIHRLAFFDTLTGLPNRAMLRAQAERALVYAEKHQESLAVLFVDLDRFKFVNDSQGHAAGDQLLHEVARRLTQTVRGDDLVGRLSGDEFVAVLPACSAEHAATTAQRILAAVARPFLAGEVTLIPGASVGVAMYPQDGGEMATLLRHADMAMYQAKSEGRGQLRFFSDEMNRAARERVELEAALRDALQHHQLELHYQPQLQAQGGRRVYCVEALVRWRHPRFGLVPPARFVPLAEECGLIGALTRWVLAEACRQMAVWRRRGVPVPRVAVNVSAGDFLDDGLPAHLAALLRVHGLLPQDLALEMTETTMVDSSPAVLANIEAVHALGIRLALDDFGTGYSSLSYLHRLPIDELKLDKSFVQDLSGNPTVQVLINTILRIGESLRMAVVAEGVETEEQLAFLAERGCPVVQGYLFARPLPAAELERWFEEQAGTPAPALAAAPPA